MNKDTIAGTFAVAISLCLAASLLVSGAAVGLKPIQERNKALDRKKNILIAAGLYEGDETIDRIYADKVVAKAIDIETGEYTDQVDPASYSDQKAAKDPKTQYVIPSDKDIAGIRTRAPFKIVYEITGAAGNVEQVVLPIHGKGLWSTLFGFLAVEKDGNTIKGLGFYQHAETPGLGGEVDNPNWKALWPGKKIYDEQQEVKIEVIKGRVDTSRPESKFQIDGLSGATITARGVSHLVQYWVSDQGYRKYLDKIRAM